MLLSLTVTDVEYLTPELASAEVDVRYRSETVNGHVILCKRGGTWGRDDVSPASMKWWTNACLQDMVLSAGHEADDVLTALIELTAAELERE